MSGNSFGEIFRITTFGESHGEAIGGIIDGCPANLNIDEKYIQTQLDRRRPGQTHTSARKEPDKVNFFSGIFENKTTGTPIGFNIYNKDALSKDYDKLKNIFRPGHGDYSYAQKYGIRDHRGGGRASARETVSRVVAGSIAKLWLQENYKIKVEAFCSQIGDVVASNIDIKDVSTNHFGFPDNSKIHQLEQLFDSLDSTGNSVGAKITVIASNVPAGVGEPVFAKLDAKLAYAIMGINAVKSVSIGEGETAANCFGSNFNDGINPTGFNSNNAGGILAGISTGQDIICHAIFKPTSSIKVPANTIDDKLQPTKVEVRGRHDKCVALRAPVIVESMVALVIMDNILLQQAKLGRI